MKIRTEILIIVAVILGALALRYVNPYYLADLPIVPDSSQYAIGGYNLAQSDGYHIFINDLRLPPQYPPGLPLILAPFYRLTGAELHEGIYVILAFGLLSILITFLFTRGVFGPPTAIIAALLLAVAPSYVGYSQVLISDTVSNTFIIIGLWLAWLAATRERVAPLLWIAAGISCGFSATVHLLSGLTLVPLLVACIIKASGRFREIISPLSLAAAGFVIGLSPLLIFNQIEFGNIFRSGYDYWARWGEGQQNFSILYAIRNTAVSEAGDQRGNISFFMAHFLGLSWPTLFAPYFPSVLFLAICAFIACFRRRISEGRGGYAFALISVSLIVTVVIVLFFYSFQMSKFLLPIVPFICILAARGIVILWKACRGSDARSRLLRIPIILLLLLTAWGCWRPYSKGHFSTSTPTWWYEGMATLNELAPDNAYLISGIDGVYVTHYFTRGTRRTYMPISREVEYIRQRELPLSVALENMDEIERILRSGRKIYLDGFTARYWSGPCTILGSRFGFKPVRPYYGGKLLIYELTLKR